MKSNKEDVEGVECVLETVNPATGKQIKLYNNGIYHRQQRKKSN